MTHDEASRFEKRMEVLSEQLHATNLQIASFLTECNGCRLTLRDLKAEVFGNGKEGLKIRTDRLEQSRRMLLWVVGAASGMAGGFMGFAGQEIITRLLK